jgi:hypothetical protein
MKRERVSPKMVVGKYTSSRRQGRGQGGVMAKCQRSYVPVSCVQKWKAEQDRQFPNDLITRLEAARVRGVTPQAIHHLIRKGLLTVQWHTIACKGGKAVRRQLLSRAEVEGQTPPLAIPQPPPKRRGGRRADAETARVHEFCFDRYIKGDKLAIIRRAAEPLFGSRAPKEDGHVTTYAKRHADKNGIPWTPR